LERVTIRLRSEGRMLTTNLGHIVTLHICASDGWHRMEKDKLSDGHLGRRVKKSNLFIQAKKCVTIQLRF
jgi:hypothetical protein